MPDFGDIDGRFEFFAVVTPDGKIPTVDDTDALNDPSLWYTGPIGTLSHLSDYAMVFTDWDDARGDFQRHLNKNLQRGKWFRRQSPSGRPNPRSRTGFPPRARRTPSPAIPSVPCTDGSA
jgi:hypothetical protein